VLRPTSSQVPGQTRRCTRRAPRCARTCLLLDAATDPTPQLPRRDKAPAEDREWLIDYKKTVRGLAPGPDCPSRVRVRNENDRGSAGRPSIWQSPASCSCVVEDRREDRLVCMDAQSSPSGHDSERSMGERATTEGAAVALAHKRLSEIEALTASGMGFSGSGGLVTRVKLTCHLRQQPGPAGPIDLGSRSGGGDSRWELSGRTRCFLDDGRAAAGGGAFGRGSETLAEALAAKARALLRSGALRTPRVQKSAGTSRWHTHPRAHRGDSGDRGRHDVRAGAAVAARRLARAQPVKDRARHLWAPDACRQRACRQLTLGRPAESEGTRCGRHAPASGGARPRFDPGVTQSRSRPRPT